MKKVVILNLCALILILLTAGVYAGPDTDSETIASLLESRIAILNHYYGGKMSFKDAQSNMQRIVSDSLLKEDVKLMKAFDGDDVDQVASFHLNVVSCQRTSYGIIKGQAEICWLMQGENGRWNTEESYYFTAEDNQGTVKLTQLKKL